MAYNVSENVTPPSPCNLQWITAEMETISECWQGPLLWSLAWEAAFRLCYLTLRFMAAGLISVALPRLSPRISPAHWRLLGYHWPGHWVLGIHGIPQSIWMVLLSPLNRPALSSDSAWLWIRAGFLSVFTQLSLAESGMVFKNQSYLRTTYCSWETIHTVQALTYSAAHQLCVNACGCTQFSMWELFPVYGCINELADVRGDGVIT